MTVKELFIQKRVSDDGEEVQSNTQPLSDQRNFPEPKHLGTSGGSPRRAGTAQLEEIRAKRKEI